MRSLKNRSNEASEVFRGALKFEDIDHYYEVYDCLEAEYEAWCDQYAILYSNQTDDQYNAQIDQNGWDEEIPLDDFEAEISGYLSLKKHINQLETIWLENAVLDDGTDPDNLYIDDEIDRTLINSESNVTIGGSVWHFVGLDAFFEITNNNCELLEDVMNNPDDFQNGQNPNVIYHRNHDGTAVPDDCEYKCYNPGTHDNCASWKQFIWKLIFKTGTPPFSQSKTIAKIRSFKIKGNGNWKKWRTRLKVNVVGDWYGYTCNVYNSLYKEAGWKRRKHLRVKNTLNDEWYWHHDELAADFFQTSTSCTLHHVAVP